MKRRTGDMLKTAKVMKYVFITILVVLYVILITGCSSTPYVKAGAGYKVSETNIHWQNSDGTYNEGNHPISARFEVGLESGNWSYGVSHHSQFFTGAPFNDKDGEYQKTELFIDYKYTWE